MAPEGSKRSGAAAPSKRLAAHRGPETYRDIVNRDPARAAGASDQVSSGDVVPGRGMNFAPVGVEYAHGDGGRRPVRVDDKLDRV